MTFIHSPDAAPAGGHYSPALVHNGLVYISGILPITPLGEKLTHAPLSRQVEVVLANLRAVLAAAGSGPQHVLQVRIYVTDMASWTEVNRLYAIFFGDHKPARAVVPVPALHFGLNLELEATARVAPL